MSDSTTPYEQTVTLDAYSHQSITYTDGLGRTRYNQVFKGTASPYNVTRTVAYSYDTPGNTTQVQTYDSTGAVQASYNATFDGLKRRTGFNDSDLGSCSSPTMPASCSSNSDMAWTFTYDGDGNMLSQTDARNQTTYTSYDVLDRPLCRGTSSSQVSPCQSSAYAQYFYDSYDNSSNSSLSFPSGCSAPTGSYASDPIGHVTAEVFSSSAGNGWRCYGYDQRGQLDQSTLSVTADGTTTTQTVNMSYNDGGEITQLVYPGSGGTSQTLTSQYNANGRFQSAYFGTSSTPDPVSFLVASTAYTGAGLLKTLNLGGSGPKNSGGSVTPVFQLNMSYDNIQRPLSTSASENGTTIWNQTRTYDNVGNVLQLSTTIPTSGGGTQVDNQSFCYDALNRLVWAGDTGTPTGGDHCGNVPTGTTISTYQQSFSYDSLDRITSGPMGTVGYNNNHVHAANTLGSIPNKYATYDDIGDMTCRNVDTTTAHVCNGTSPTGAIMTYDNEGRLATWTAPSGTTASDSFLYDNEGNRVLQRTSDSNGITDTITFDGYTEKVINGSTTTTSKFYTVNAMRLALRQASTLYYLLPDLLGSPTVALNSDGSFQAVQLFNPYGSSRYSSGSMPTDYSFTGQRLDSETGLLYYNFRYYDPVSGRFTRADTVDSNASGMDGYAYVMDSPESKKDPTGHSGSLGDDAAQQFVEEWYMQVEGINGILIDQPSTTHNPAIAISNAALPKWDGSVVALRQLIQSMPGLIANGGTSGNGYPDIMNENLHLIYEVKGGERLPNGGTGFPNIYTVIYGWAQARWYAAMANRDPYWNQNGTWDVGNNRDTKLLQKFASCGGACLETMPDGRQILIMNAGNGVLTYWVLPQRTVNFPNPNYYPSWYAKWAPLIGGIALLAAAAGSQPSPGGNNVVTGGFDSPGIGWVGPGSGCSFTSDTVVLTPEGEQAIGQLQVGEQVVAYNVQSHILEAEPIIHIWVHDDYDLINLTIRPVYQPFVLAARLKSELVHTTSVHPFLTEEEGFVAAGQLQVGMHVLQADGSVGVITMIQRVPGNRMMYNLEVAHDHTFMVGEGQWIVHNDCF